MKTVLVNKDGSLSVQEVPKPKYGPKQALTKTIANGICGTDIHLMKKAFKGVTEEMYPLMLEMCIRDRVGIDKHSFRQFPHE